ncbi:hypothetical protein LXL04_020028 [Taraxacum kok-saghyz]
MSSNLFSPPKPKNYRPPKSENLNIAIQPHWSSSAADLSPPSAAAHRRSSALLLAGLQLRYSPASLVRTGAELIKDQGKWKRKSANRMQSGTMNA